MSSDGSIVVGSSPHEGSGATAGPRAHTRVYQNVSWVWTQIGADINGKAANNHSGSSILLSGDGTILAIGSPRNNNGNMQKCGLVRIYQNIGDFWTLLGTDIFGLEGNHLNGTSVSLSSNGTTISIGTPMTYDSSLPGMTGLYNLSTILSSDDFELSNFSIYPNPLKDFVIISKESSLQLEKVTIYNQLGQLVKTAANNVIDISELANGSYFVEIVINKGKGQKYCLKAN
ncbi:T9SS type A sorting domain-containing protein [Flavobacterium sp. UBA7682]|uniref:T9SS type A sorting domain-containing protein n=1 Tax=Flavobacterium sp. UBA7682 TaxID=1946560 RepID=UPI0025B94BAE|nr:T9SS type A sorting domain-containing protein [Flavobacterium sp. UBA7682]